MSTTAPPQDPQTQPKPASLNEAIEFLLETAHRAASPKSFLREALRIAGSFVGGAYAELEVRMGASVIQEHYAFGAADPEFWAPTAKSLLTDTLSQGKPQARLFRRKDSSVRLAVLCTPIHAANSASGAAIVIVPCQDADYAEKLISEFSALGSLVGQLLHSITNQDRVSRTASLDKLASLKRVADYTSETELAFALTNKLRTRDGCDQVAIGVVDETRVRIVSISGLDEIPKKTPGVRAIQAAMEECVDFKMPVVHQNGIVLEDKVARPGRLQKRWSETASGAPVASIPLFAGKQCVAVLSIRRAVNVPFREEDLTKFKELVEPYAASLEMVRLAHRSLFRHAYSATTNYLGALFAPGSWGAKLAVTLAAALGIWSVFGSMSYRVPLDCRVAPSAMRHIAAPFDAILRAAPLVPGDQVQAGQVLCELDTESLRLEIAGLESELGILEIEHSRALAENDPATMQLARANQKQVEARLELLSFKIEQSLVRSPVDGIVLEGDLRGRVGDVFVKGDPLLQVSTREGWELELEVPEWDLTHLRAGMTGRFASLSRPEETYPFEITRIEPNAQNRAGANIFVALAKTDIRADWVRSGVEGRAKVDAGTRSPIWVLFHRAADWVRLQLWL